jgi:peptidyl-tRNA hydrolase
MGVGKSCSQAGHAYLGSFCNASADRQKAYHADGIGTKICLSVPNLEKLLIAYDKAKALGLPCTLIEDTGNNTTFNGVPTISAVGIGPILSHEAPFLRRFPLCT